MAKRPNDYEDDAPTRVETPLPTQYNRETRQYLFPDDEPQERRGAQRT